METLINEKKIKQIFKEAFIEAIEEKQNFFHDMIVEAIEDIALGRLIQEGQNSGEASRKEVFDILENKK